MQGASFARFQLGGEIFLLTFPLIEQSSGQNSFGSPKISGEPPACSIRGNVKRKYFSLELKCAEDWSRHSAPSTRFCPVRCDVIVRGRLRPGMRVVCDPGRIFLISAPGRSVVRADHREAEAAAGLY